MKPGDSSLQVRRHRYDQVAGVYDHVMAPLEALGLKRLRAAIWREIPSGTKLLEIGAGTGANFRFYPHAERVVATEPSMEMLRIARDKSERPGTVDLVQARGEQLPFADGTFDAACATLVFCSVMSPAAVFAELRRVVRKGGTVALLEHVRPPGLLGHAFDILSRVTVALFDDHFNRRTADDARLAGLSVVRVESHLLGIVQIIVCKT